MTHTEAQPTKTWHHLYNIQTDMQDCAEVLGAISPHTNFYRFLFYGFYIESKHYKNHCRVPNVFFPQQKIKHYRGKKKKKKV